MKPCPTGIAVALITSLAAGCRGGSDPAAESTATAQAIESTAPQAQPVATVTAVGRAEILAAAALAADQVAAGGSLPDANKGLFNRTFELRLPFGCTPGDKAGWGTWNFDRETGVLRIRVQPEILTSDPLIAALATGLTYDAAEGFWIDRPWTRTERCPETVPDATPSSPGEGPSESSASESAPMRILAIVQYLSPDQPRSMRRGSRPYAYTGKVTETENVGAEGFHLRLKGRIKDFGDGQPIRCRTIAQYQPPVCALAVDLAQVGLEDGATGTSLAEWGN